VDAGGTLEGDGGSIGITWVGHATVVIETAGFRLITDPALTTGLAHLRRRVAAPRIGPCDAVLLSHLHMDHLHTRSLKQVAEGATFVVPEGAEPLIRPLRPPMMHSVTPGDRVVLREGDDRVEVIATPADHSDRRGPHSRIVATPVGFVIEIGGRRIYFAGDTDLYDEMPDLGPLDLALVPIWGWGPTLGERHLDPTSAATATALLDPVHVIPIHWGTYSPVRFGLGAPSWLENPIEAFRAELETLGLADRLLALRPGGSTTLAAVRTN
jgi:L-ascorbate metabolism protein UlaG (beta-lactamase superfamily)